MMMSFFVKSGTEKALMYNSVTVSVSLYFLRDFVNVLFPVAISIAVRCALELRRSLSHVTKDMLAPDSRIDNCLVLTFQAVAER